MKRAHAIAWSAAGVGVATAGALVWALGPGAPTVASWLIDNAEVWRLGRLHVEGLSGPHIGALRAERVTIADEDGVWVEGRDVAFDWSPASLFGGRVDIALAEVGAIEVFRQPVLSAELPAGPAPFDVDIASMRSPSIRLREAVVGREATLRFEGSLDMNERELVALALDLARTDQATDALSFRLGGGQLLNVQLTGAPRGVFAAALGAPDEAVTLTGAAQGDETQGQARLAGRIGEDELTAGDLRWTARAWQATFRFDASQAPLFNEIARRFGPRVTASASGDRVDNRPGAFRLNAEAENASFRAQGALTRDWRIEGDVAVSAHVSDLNRAAREMGLGAGDAAFDGTIRFENDSADIRGQSRIGALEVAGLRADAQGPVRVLYGESAHSAELDLALTPDRASRRLLSNARLRGELRYHRREERFEIASAVLESDALRLSAAGRIDDENGALEGEWRIADLSAASAEVSGASRGRWRMTRAADRPWQFEARGGAERFRAREPAIAQLVGAAPRLELDADLDDRGFRIRRGVLQGAKLRIGAAGMIAEAYDLRVEASAIGPVRLGAAEFAGVADLTGTITGPAARPRVQANLQLAQFDIAGLSVERPAATLEYDAGARRGALSIVGAVNGAAARADAEVSVENGAILLTNATADFAGFSARGDASIGNDGPALHIAFSGPLTAISPDATGTVEGAATLTPARNAAPALDATGAFRNAAFGDMRFAQARIALRGPLDRINLDAALAGRSGDSTFDMTLEGVIAEREEGGSLLTLEARGDLGGESLATRAPAEIVLADGAVDARASVVAGDGGAEISWRSERDTFAASATFDGAELAPFAALGGARAEGTLSGDVRIETAGDNLAGAAHLTIDGARLPARMRAPLNMRIDAELAPTRITGSLRARSSDGLDASIEGAAPVETRADPLRIALSPEGEGRLQWRAQGPADSLWPLVGGLDQSLGGRIEGEGAVRFTASSLAGSGELSLTDGRFEDKRAGLTFADVDARLTFQESGASRFTLSAQDEQGGRLTGEGQARGAQDGRIALAMSHLRFIDREDMRAVASGDLALTWTPDGAELSGAITLDQAEVTLTTQSDAVIPEIEVVEINRPGGDLPPPRPRAPGPAARLDLALSAPGRVYTRGRGLNAEWSLDAHIRGTTRNPLILGDARLIRGEFDLAGRPFELQRGRIQLMGQLEETRVDLLAERIADELTARIAITGLLFNPDITLSSDPALPEDEILPQVLFGRGAEDLSPLEGAQLAASLAALAGGSAFDIASMARSAIGLDRLDVREDGAGVLIAGGRYLTRDVYFEVSRTGLGQAGAKLEWRARPQLSLVTSFLANGDQRVSVRWRHDY